MAIDDERLLDFDTKNLASYSEAEARRALAGEDGDVFRSHLVIARWLDKWCERMSRGPALDEKFQEGFERGIREVAAHLRQGDLLPGEEIYVDAVED